MIEAVGFAARGLHTATALLVFGTLVCLHLPPTAARAAVMPWLVRWLSIAMILCACALLLGIAVFGFQVVAVQTANAWGETVSLLLRESRYGTVWIARQLLTLASTALIACALRGTYRAIGMHTALLTSGTALAIEPLSGHSAALEPAWPVLIAHAAHLIAAAAWWGALPALAGLTTLCARGSVDRGIALAAFTRFSILALPLMGLIVASGVALAFVHVERWPALLGTRYGAILLAKILLLIIVLALAAKLRWRLLPALRAGDGAQIALRCAHWIAAEGLIAAAIVLLAAQLAQTVPARHDDVTWWLPFRFSVDATWDLSGTSIKVGLGLALLLGAITLSGLAIASRVARARGYIAASALLVASAALGLPAISVEAYPDTYRKPTVPFQTISVAAGQQLYAVHCAGCHGTSGHGDGPQARALSRPPVDLTEPHTALHTAGDMFWWLTHGKPPGIMPGFGQRLSEDDKWDLINFLRTLSLGYQARILSERVVPERPWLPAVDFNYATRQGDSGALKDFRGRNAVLIVFYTLPGSNARLAQLAEIYPRLRDARVEVLAVPVSQDAGQPTLPALAEGAAETTRAYALLRRTLSNLDARDRTPVPQHMELLVDRFGYIRARWLPTDGAGWTQIEVLLAQARVLQRESQIKPPPDDHVH